CLSSAHQEILKFVGHIFPADEVRPDPDKTKAVKEMEERTNVSELRSLLGMVNNLGRFIPGLADKDNCAQQKAFNQLLYDPNKELKLSADASSYGLGAVLFQKEGEKWRPVAYASPSLTETEQRWVQVEKQVLELTWRCERFKDFLIGRQFSLETDHKPLISLLGQQALTELPPRIQRF
uniref:Reverse transcriptase RNase H-like domain-containing protein n=1 Tax=Cyprinodon variegatus TaxID=28743 RepID=A0A3Q2E2F1_CYPVA